MHSRQGARFSLVAFDLDGVLVDTARCHSRAFAELWQRMQLEGPDYREIAGRRTVEVVSEVASALQPAPETLSRWVAFKQTRARELVATEQIVFDDAAACVRGFVADGLRVALGTGASRPSCQVAIARLGLEGVFEVIVTAEDVASGKPDPGVYARVAKLAGVSTEDMLVVEDSEAGLSSGLEAGAWAVAVRSGVVSNSARFLGSYEDLGALRREFSGAGE